MLNTAEINQKEYPISKEMLDFYKERTNKHIGLVQKYCKKIYDLNPSIFKGIIERGKDHDKSKLEDPNETVPYIYITWDYHCKDNGEDSEIPESIKKEMNKASEIHVKSNRHHPEFHSNKEIGLINRENRDKKPKQIIDASSMGLLDICEMCADWAAMSEEKGTNTPQEWADKNIGIKWNFTDVQKSLIYDLLDAIWGKEKKAYNYKNVITAQDFVEKVIDNSNDMPSEFYKILDNNFMDMLYKDESDNKCK